MAKFIKLNVLRVFNIPNSDDGHKYIKSEIYLNIDHIVLVEQSAKGCVIHINAPICDENSEYTRNGEQWKPQSVASVITVEESYNDVVAMIGC